MNNIIKFFILLCLVLLTRSNSYAQDIAGNGDISTLIAPAKGNTKSFSKSQESLNGENPIPACDTVIEFKIIQITTNSVKIQWKHSGNYAKTKYRIIWQEYGKIDTQKETAWLVAQCGADCPENYTIMGLSYNTEYQITIEPLCDFSIPNTNYATYLHKGSLSKIRKFTTPDKCDFSNGNISINSDYKEARIQTSGFMGSVGDKLIDAEISLANNNNLLTSASGDVQSATPITFPNLQPCQNYNIRARAKCKNPGGTYSLGDWQSFSAKTKCCGELSWYAAPTATYNSITVKWYRSIYAPEQKFKLIIVDSRYQTETYYVSAANLSNSTQNPIETYTFNNLIENERYSVYVYPLCDCTNSSSRSSDPSCSITGQGLDASVVTADACALPKSIKVTNLQSNQLTVNIEAVATPKARRYTVQLEDKLTGSIISTKEVLSLPNSGTEVRVDFNGLTGSTNYNIKVKTECCAAGNYNPNVTTSCYWTIIAPATTTNPPTDFETITIQTPSVVCVGIGSVQTSNITSHKATVTWASTLGRNYQIQLRRGLLVERDSIIEGAANSIAYTYYGLEPFADYSVKVIALCCQSSNTPCSKWSSGENASVAFKTNFILGPNCGTTAFTLTSEADKIMLAWTEAADAPALSPTGRRFIVQYGANPMQTQIISSPNGATINGLSPSTSYTLKIKEVFDGSYENYTIACNEIVENKTTLAPPTTCDFSFSADFSCIGERYMAFHITQDANKKDNNIRIYYRPVPVTEDCDQVTNIVNPTSTADVTTAFMNKVFAGEEFYYLTDLEPCKAYEVYFETYKRNVNGTEELCQKFTMPQWYMTKRSGTVPTLDTDGDGFPDQCDPIENPLPKPKTHLDLKDLACGDPIDALNLTNSSSPHTTGAIGETWMINGFPFQVEDITLNVGNVYSGSGFLSLPFGKGKGLKITFDNITVVKMNVTNKYYVSAGEIRGFKDGLPDLPKLIEAINLKQGDAYKRFCQEPGYESGSNVNSNTNQKWDERGFCKDGTYCRNPPYPGYVNGTNYDKGYDPMGFDKAGNHVNNGSKYDDCGCDYLGNAAPAPSDIKCNKGCKAPYYWMAASPVPTKEGQAYFNTVKDDLEAKIKAILAAKLLTVTADLSVSQGICNTHIASMDAAYGTLGYQTTDKPLVYGPNNAWVNTGMYKFFDKVPVVFKEMNNRASGQDALELAHNNLYLEDVKRTKLTLEKEIIEGLMTAASIQNLSTAFGQRLQSMDKEALKELQKDVNHPTLWLTKQIDTQIAYEYGIKNSTGAIETEDDGTRLAEAASRQTTPFASNDETAVKAFLATEKNANTAQEEWERQLRFEYEQGWQTVGGMDRALILEQIQKERLLNDLLIGGANKSVGEPFPILTDKDGRIQAVYLDDVKITTTTASANFYAIVETGKNEQQIVFKAEGFSFNASGILDPIYLGLASEVKVPMNNALMLTLKGSLAGTSEPTTGTYVKFSCENGFEGLQIDTDIEICNHYVLPLINDGTGNYPLDGTDNKFVKVSAKAFFGSFNDILFTVKISPFALAKHKDFKLIFDQDKDIVIDFSDIRTLSTVTFPSEYLTGDVKLWRGLYMPGINVLLPTQLFKSKDGKPKIAYAKDFIFDGGGITGRFGAKDLLPESEGTLGGWSFSITDLEMQIKRNTPVGGGFGGEIHIPIFKEGQNLKYTARVMPNNEYEFAMSPTTDDPNKKFEIPLWLAKVDLAKTSIVKIAYINDVLSATAILDGTVSIGNDTEGSGKSKMAMKGLTFQGLTLTTLEKPYLKSPGFWDVPKQTANVAGFSFFLDKVGLNKIQEKEVINGVETSVDKTALHFIVGFELVGDPNKGFNIGATGDFDLIGKVTLDAQQKQKWEYERLRMNALEVHAKTKGFSLDGGITFFGPNSSIQAPEYGKGFYGYIAVSFEGMSIEKNPETKAKEKDVYGITALAVFGRKDGATPDSEYKYFMVDLMVMLGKGVNLGGALKLKAAGGGISWHMERQPMTNGFAFSNKDIRTIPLGGSISGFTYLPNNNSGLSIRLMVALAAQKEKAFSANAQFEISFSPSGGIEKIRLDGLAKFMQEPVAEAPPVIATPGIPIVVPIVNGMMAGIAMEYIIQKREFHANLDVYANVQNGKIKGCAGGCNAPYRVGSAEVFIGPKEWYINVGRTTANPDEFVQLGVRVAGLDLRLETYFNIGTKIPPMPKLPEKVLQILGNEFKPIDEGLRSTGKGIAFGARFAFQVNHDGFWVDVDAEAGLGFDLMLADYGETRCLTSNGGSDRIGINGWYATGQAFAYASAKVSFLGKPLADIGGAAVLQFSGPNPFFVQGDLAAMINGKSKKFHIEKGERCGVLNTNTGTANVETKVIATITPDDKNAGVNRQTNPTIAFEVPVGKSFKYTNISGQEITVETQMPRILLTDDNNYNYSSYYTEVWNDKNTSMELELKKPLPPNTKLKLAVEVGISQTGVASSTEAKSVEFTTEDAWKNIPKSNVTSSYPADGMANFYLDQQESGWVALNYDQSDLMSSSDELTPKVRFFVASTKKMVAEVPFTYNPLTKQIAYTIPSSKLSRGGVYKMQFVLAAEANSGAVSSQTVSTVELLDIYFRTSVFGTFGSKMKAALFPVTKSTSASSPYDLTIDMNVYEGFDDYETGNVEGQMPLILVEDQLKTDPWYTGYALPNVYNAYPTHKPTTLPGDELLTLANEGSAVMQRVTKDAFDRNNYATNGYPKGRVVYNKYQKVKDVLIKEEQQNKLYYNNCKEGCVIRGDLYDDVQGTTHTVQNCQDECILVTVPAFTIPPTSTKLTFKYMLYPFDKTDKMGATTGRRNDNSLPAGTVPDNAIEKSTFEVTVNH